MTDTLTVDEETIYRALRSVCDPGLAEPIVDLGLVYGVRVQSSSRVTVDMTMPTPHYPHAAEFVQQVRQSLQTQPGVTHVEVHLVWDPPWTPYRMTGPLKAVLGLPDQEPTGSIQLPEQPAATRRGWFGRLFGR